MITDFEVLSQVGKGLNSTVFKVHRIQDDRIYAMKKVKMDGLPQKQIVSAINEVRFLASIRHPSVITYKEAFFDPQSRSLCIIMEYADGGDLLKRIFEQQRKGHPLSEEFIWSTFLQLLKGLYAVHQLKITHRDLKSSNIFLTENGGVKLGGFNVSIVLGKGMMCNSQAGTPYYASPEVFRDEAYNSKSDMWSLGCVLYELLHLKPPFRARDMDKLSVKVNRGYYGKIDRVYSEELVTMIQALLNIDPFERLSSKELLNHRIVKARLRRGKLVQNLEASTLLKTIRPAKNLIYLTDRLPKPNYQPVRYRSYFQLKDYEAPHQKYGNSMQELPNLNHSFSKSLNKSLSKSQFVSQKSHLSPRRSGRASQFDKNPEWLPRIPRLPMNGSLNFS